MFSLIITIISIALVAALALATLYFGGDAFNQGSAKAAASTLVNQASQINGANTLYFLDNQSYTDIATLATDGKYLAATPNPGTAGNAYVVDEDGTGTVGEAGGISSDGVSLAVCQALNVQSSADETIPAAIDGLSDVQFGCFGATGAYTFVYK